eukprot:9197370-Lingulodinium_polyedra.AAC.1
MPSRRSRRLAIAPACLAQQGRLALGPPLPQPLTGALRVRALSTTSSTSRQGWRGAVSAPAAVRVRQ